MCFGKAFVQTLLVLPWLYGVDADRFNNSSVIILYNAPPQRLLSALEEMGRQTDISICKATDSGPCIATDQCSEVLNGSGTCSWLVYQHNLPQDLTSSLKAWSFGLASVAVISLSGLFGGLFWPIINSNLYQQVMHILIGLALGSLSATSIFQLIPEGFQVTRYNKNYLETALWMWACIWMLYMLQILCKIVFHTSQNGSRKRRGSSPESQADILLSYGNNNVQDKTLVDKAVKKSRKETTIAYMIIFGDALHNFIDGMSIGAGYSQDVSAGLRLSIAVACEEFPHELGDFAILINSGMPLRKALLYNFLSACTAFGGLAVGIVMGELKTSTYIFTFAGGLFLYIALAELIPELNRMVIEELENGRTGAVIVVVLQNIGAFVGVTTLYFVSKYPLILS